ADLSERNGKLAEYSHDLQMVRGMLQQPDTYDEQAAELSSALAEERATSAILNAQLTQVSAAFAEQQKALKKLRRSSSWKLTRPWRASTRVGRVIARRTSRTLSAVARAAISPLRVPLRRNLLK